MSTNLPFRINGSNPYADAEPYFYGSGSPAAGYFRPIGEDNDDKTTTDTKVQLAESNGYSITKYVAGLKINGNSLAYIEQGTFPIMRLLGSYESNYVASAHNESGTNATTVDKNNGEADEHKAFCKLVISYDTTDKDKPIKNITLNYYHLSTKDDPASNHLGQINEHNLTASTTIYDKASSATTFTKHNTEICPKRIGFILTGGGGGAGGISQLDPDKNKSGGDQYTTSGGGGGGAEIVYGVFDVTHPSDWSADAATLTYTVYLGNGGAGGEHGNAGDTSHNNPQYGSNGSDGYDSIVWVSTDKIANEELFHACGGLGGNAGSLDKVGAGGNGGSYEGIKYGNLINKKTKNCTLRGRIRGGNGGTLTNDTMANEKFHHTIYFSNSIPPKDKSEYCLNIAYDALTGANNTSTDRSGTNVPGGHSLGKGGTKDINPSRGAGGCCNNSGGRDGAGGYFGLYY